MSTAVSLALLVAVLGFAVVRPRGLPEAVGAVPAAVVTVVAGLVPWRDAVPATRRGGTGAPVRPRCALSHTRRFRGCLPDRGTSGVDRAGRCARSRRTAQNERAHPGAEANPGFCLFVFALGVVVLGVSRGGFGVLVDRVAPHHADLVGLLAMAGLAALLANLLNNLPATLMLLPFAAHSPGLVLAVLLGANIGPNLTYVGSLATLLWRQILHKRGHPPVTGEFLRLGALTVPACLLAGVASLWVSLRVSGL